MSPAVTMQAALAIFENDSARYAHSHSHTNGVVVVGNGCAVVDKSRNLGANMMQPHTCIEALAFTLSLDIGQRMANSVCPAERARCEP